METIVSRNNKAFTFNAGDVIGEFVIVRGEMVGKNKTWICRCKCGSEKRFWKASAINKQKTCGCGIDKAGLTAKQRRSMLSRMHGYKGGAKSRGFKWSLTYSQFVEIATGNCFYCNSEPKVWDCVSGAPSVQKASPNINAKDYEIKFNGIDRLNSDIGYTIENVVPCCVKCNRAKSDMPLSDFKDHVKKMYSWLFAQD
jgi:hypothetical protein